MKHRHRNRILSRTAHHRQALLKNLSSSLIKHGSIVTTEAKGKELRRYFEPLVTLARQELTLPRRRQLQRALLHERDLLGLLDIAQTQTGRPGGYLRLTKLPKGRHDSAAQVRLDIVRANAAE